jgi:hypothetical protein
MIRTAEQLAAELMHGDRLLTTGEVAALYRVEAKTVARWASADRFPDDPDGRPGVVRTLGGHRRIRASVVRGLLDGSLQMRGWDRGHH